MRPACSLLAIALWIASPAQPGRARPAAAAPQAPVPEPLPVATMEKVEIRLAQFDVVVRDRNDKIVSGLGPSDFEVFEEGGPLKVVAVDEWGSPRPSSSEIAAEAVPAAGSRPQTASENVSRERAPGPRLEQRSLILLFDLLNGGSPLRVHQAKRAALSFVRQRLRPSDTAGVYQLDTALRPLSGFTSDASELERSIARVTPLALSDLSDELVESVAAYRSRAGIHYMEQRLRRRAFLYTEMLDFQREAFYRSLQSLSDLFAGLPGRRVLVLLSGGFPMTSAGDIERESGGFTPAFRELIRKLAASGVAVYAIDIGDDLAVGDVSRTIDWRVAVGKLGMDESLLTDIGLDRALSTGSAGQRRQVLGVLAGETGGRLLTHADLARAFEIIDEESTHFYRVSCEVPEARDKSRYRKITIRVARAGVTVSARRGRYGDVVPVAERPSGHTADSLARYRPISLRGTTAILPRAGPGGTVPVAVVVEALGPIALVEDARGGAELEIDFFLIARAGEEILGRYSRSVTTRIKPGGVEPLRKSFRLEGRLDLPPGHYEVQATARIASPPQLGVWTAPLDIPVPAHREGSRVRITSLFLAAQAAGSSPLLLRFEEPEGEGDPLSLGAEGRVLPATDPSFEPSGGLVALFWLEGLPAPTEPRSQVRVTSRVRDVKGVLQRAPSRLASFQPDGERGRRGVLVVDTSSLADGIYRLELEITDPGDTTGVLESKEITFRMSTAPAAS